MALGGSGPLDCHGARSVLCHCPKPSRRDTTPGAGAGTAVAASPGARRRRGDVAGRRSMDSEVRLGKVRKRCLDG